MTKSRLNIKLNKVYQTLVSDITGAEAEVYVNGTFIKPNTCFST